MESGRTLQEQSRLRASEELGGPWRGNLCTADLQLGWQTGLGLVMVYFTVTQIIYVLLTMLQINAEVSEWQKFSCHSS